MGGEGGEGEARCPGDYSPPRALMGCTLLPPIRGLGCDSLRWEGREWENALEGGCVSWDGSQGPHLLELAFIKCPLPWVR